jgi:hypothetical protein
MIKVLSSSLLARRMKTAMLTLDELADFEALHIADHTHKRVVRALGGEKFEVPAELSRTEQEHVYLFVRGDGAYAVTQH